MPTTPDQDYVQWDDTISVATLIVIGIAILLFSILVAKVIVHFRDLRNTENYLWLGEEILVDDEVPPPYDIASRAYKAELSAELETPPDCYNEFGSKEHGGIRLV